MPTPEQVAQLVTANINLLNNYVHQAHDAGYPIGVVVNELITKVQGINIRPDLVNALLYNGGYSATAIAQFYIQNKIITEPMQVLYMLQSTGLVPDKINYVMNQLGGAYVSYATSAFQLPGVQSTIALVSKVEETLHVDKPIRYLTQETVQVATQVVNAVAPYVNPTKW